MKSLKKWIAMSALVAMAAGSAQPLSAQYYEGEGYDTSQRAPSIAPAVALGTIAVVGLIAVLAQNRSGGSHSHGN